MQDSSQFVRIWMRGETMLFTGEHRNHAPENLNVALSSFAQEETYNLEEEDDHYNQSKRENVSGSGERSSLIITNIHPKDSGEYTCRIMIRSTDEINVTHTVIVQKAGLSVQTVSFCRLVKGLKS